MEAPRLIRRVSEVLSIICIITLCTALGLAAQTDISASSKKTSRLETFTLSKIILKTKTAEKFTQTKIYTAEQSKKQKNNDPIITSIVPHPLDQNTATADQWGYYVDINGQNFSKKYLNLFYQIIYEDGTNSSLMSYPSDMLELISSNQIRMHGISEVEENLTIRFLLADRPVLQGNNIVVSNIASFDIIGLSCRTNCYEAEITGELKTWHKTIFTFTGPETDEQNMNNPFLNYRLFVHLTGPNGQEYTVLGFWAADGNAAETSAISGNKWRAYFTADQEGVWQYRVSFREGLNVAVSDDPQAGSPVFFDGLSGQFIISPTDKKAPDLRNKGRLEYVGKHYLQFKETGEYFIKSGANSPENFLAYYEFDNTKDHGGEPSNLNQGIYADGLHHYDFHLDDYKDTDPVWQADKGKKIMGALNYLSSQHVNSLAFLTMNVNGDGQEIYPWTDYNERLRFDVSKLDQWEIVFSHMDKLGMMLHIITQETENDELLNQGTLGLERKLYYRELIARFSHHLALVWNMGEEYDQNMTDLESFISYFKTHDPYKHPVTVHTRPDQITEIYDPLLGNEGFDATSLQTTSGNIHIESLVWIEQSELFGHPWVIYYDEQSEDGQSGVLPDAEDPDHTAMRKFGLWGNLMAGGAGIEWHFANNDLDCENFRSRELMFKQTHFAVSFFKGMPFQDMTNCNEDISTPSDGYCFKKDGIHHAVYLTEDVPVDVDLPSGIYETAYYNPRNGLFHERIDTVVSPDGFVSFNNIPVFDDVAILISAPSCTAGETRLCAMQDGVCSGAMQTCNAQGFWDRCQYGPNYNQEEFSCIDNLDNDCDGNTDFNDTTCTAEQFWITADQTQGTMPIDELYASSASTAPDKDLNEDSINGFMLYSDLPEDNLQCELNNNDFNYVTVNIQKEGIYYLWGRFYYPSSNPSGPNSFCVFVDEANGQSFGNSNDFQQEFHWDGDGYYDNGAPAPLLLGKLTVGEHRIRVQKRESGAQGQEYIDAPRIDMFLLTNSPDFIPTDAAAKHALGL